MRKAIVIDNISNYSLIQKYDGFPFLVLDQHLITDVTTDVRFADFSKKNSPTVVDPSQFLENDANKDKIVEAITYLYHKGFDEIVVMTNFKSSIMKMFKSVMIIKQFPSLRIMFEDGRESIQYYEEGKYVLNKEHSSKFCLCPWGDNVVISLDYTLEKITNHKLEVPLENIKFFQRIVLLNVEKGAVMLIRKSGDENEN